MGAKRAANPGMRIGRASNVPDQIVERIRSQYETGASFAKIADPLTEDGVATAQGGRRWYASTIRSVLLRSQRRSSHEVLGALQKKEAP